MTISSSYVSLPEGTSLKIPVNHHEHLIKPSFSHEKYPISVASNATPTLDLQRPKCRSPRTRRAIVWRQLDWCWPVASIVTGRVATESKVQAKMKLYIYIYIYPQLYMYIYIYIHILSYICVYIYIYNKLRWLLGGSSHLVRLYPQLSQWDFCRVNPLITRVIAVAWWIIPRIVRRINPSNSNPSGWSGLSLQESHKYKWGYWYHLLTK